KAFTATLAVNDTADHVINASESSAVSFTVSGLETGDPWTVTFKDAANNTVQVSGTGNTTTTANLSTLADRTITSALISTDGAGNTLGATGNAVAFDTDKNVVASLAVNDTADHVINASESSAVSFTVD